MKWLRALVSAGQCFLGVCIVVSMMLLPGCISDNTGSVIWRARTPQEHQADLQQAEARWRGTHGETQRLTACIAILDSRVIVNESPLSDVEQIFGGDFAIYDEQPNSGGYALVHFTPRTHVQGEYLGHWYLYISFDADHLVTRYYLTNFSGMDLPTW